MLCNIVISRELRRPVRLATPGDSVKPNALTEKSSVMKNFEEARLSMIVIYRISYFLSRNF